jgi:hypothetical protein
MNTDRGPRRAGRATEPTGVPNMLRAAAHCPLVVVGGHVDMPSNRASSSEQCRTGRERCGPIFFFSPLPPDDRSQSDRQFIV